MGKKANPKLDLLKECKYYVNGMHCASCEILVEKRLKEAEGVKSVKASLQDGSVTVKYQGDAPSLTELNQDLSRFGYSVGFSKKERSTNKPTISLTSQGVVFNTTKLLALFIGIAVIIGFLLIQKSSFIQSNSIADGAGFLGMVGYGIAAGLSSCAALIGGILLSLVKQWNEKFIDSGSRAEKLQPHILFHVGRIAGFALLGGVLGLIGSQLELNSVFNSVLIVSVSIIMLILALQMLEVQWANKIKITMPKLFGRKLADNRKVNRFTPLLIGVATFLLPCAFTLNAQALALTSGNFWSGAFLMFSFAIGTFIPLFLISFTGVNANSKPKLTAIFNRSAGLFMLFLALYTINSQLNLLNLPSLSDIKFGNSVTASGDFASKIDGVQVLEMYANGFNYYLSGANTLKAGEPAVIRLDNQGIQGCGTYLAARGLIDGYVNLKFGQNIIDLGNPQPGEYKVTCSMGMVEPVTVYVK